MVRRASMNSLITILSLIALLSASMLQARTFYKWVDEKGTVNYADDYNSIPSAHRDRVDIYWVHEEGSSPPNQKVAPEKREETGRDVYGQSEAYWKAKIHPWKEFLKAAEANYEKSHEKFMEKAMELGARKFWKPNTIQNEYHRVRSIGENCKGGPETKANPDWLK